MVLELRNISKSYRIAGRRSDIVRDISLSVDRGELITISGKSGCGKTTLLNIISGITRPDHGSVLFHDRKVATFSDIISARRRNREVGFIFQTFRLLPQESVMTNVLLPARIRGRVNGETRRYADEILGKLRIYKYRNSRTALLSGGQKQRVAIARALINRPSIILADEPTANLDMKTSLEIFSILEEIRDAGAAVILVSHTEYMHARSKALYWMEEGALRPL
jgi:putative ABC transport system ATP-binding protein